MGQIVGAFGTAHILMKRGSAGEAGERVFAGMKEVGRRIRALDPTLAVIVSSDHFYNYAIGEERAFAVAAADSFTPYGDMHIPTDPLPSNAGFARDFAAFVGQAGFALEVLEDYRPDHGVVIPALMIGRRSAIPIVPVITNTARDPAPSMADGWRLGTLLRAFIVSRTAERVAVIGTGGLSHWLGVPEMGRVNPDFDHEVLDALTAGEGERLTSWSAAKVEGEGGNGGLEIVNWLTMAACVPGARGERIYYEPIAEWVTGMGGIELFANEAH